MFVFFCSSGSPLVLSLVTFVPSCGCLFLCVNWKASRSVFGVFYNYLLVYTSGRLLLCLASFVSYHVCLFLCVWKTYRSVFGVFSCLSFFLLLFVWKATHSVFGVFGVFSCVFFFSVRPEGPSFCLWRLWYLLVFVCFLCVWKASSSFCFWCLWYLLVFVFCLCVWKASHSVFRVFGVFSCFSFSVRQVALSFCLW